jgi:hypothetical protein
MLEVAVVGQTGLRVKVQSHLDIVVADLQRFGEPGQSSKRSLRQIPGAFIARETKQRLA